MEEPSIYRKSIDVLESHELGYPKLPYVGVACVCFMALEANERAKAKVDFDDMCSYVCNLWEENCNDTDLAHIADMVAGYAALHEGELPDFSYGDLKEWAAESGWAFGC